MIREWLIELMLIPGLSGHEDRVAKAIAAHLDRMGLPHRSDRLGNLMATFPGDPGLPSVMVFTHMDQLGFVVRKIEADGLIRRRTSWRRARTRSGGAGGAAVRRKRAMCRA